ncbi:ABC transporter ATP-binding protein [Nocardia miyunensis]|uniref:ABC transporter ATP-binding protein n=1 Tax=Nocardia miyunensis TaxID=282684 RepID=UPI0008346326|nr:ABC transporter ATP-binding protein [Nocardia miyunensis]
MRIDIKEVTKVFDTAAGQIRALDPITLAIEANEIVCIVGSSGCGKTTLLNIIAGLETATAGVVEVDGAVVTGTSPDRGVIFQQYALFPWLTVRQNVEFGLSLKRIPAAERKRIAAHYIDLVDLTDAADQLPRQLSGGMKQRCAIARAYAVQPKVLLMDEPFGALDAMTKTTLQEQLLDAWSAEPRTVVFITHDIDEAVYLGNRVVVMSPKPGRIANVIDIDLPRPRNPELRVTPEFNDLRRQVWDAVHGRGPHDLHSQDPLRSTVAPGEHEGERQ